MAKQTLLTLAEYAYPPTTLRTRTHRKVHTISGHYIRIAHEIFIHQIYDFTVWLGARPGNLVTHIEARSVNGENAVVIPSIVR